jgi:hypothetical protein
MSKVVMAIYHLSVKVISRANGSSALASAAYRSGSRLHDQRLDRDHDFSNKSGVVHSEVMLPENAPDAWRDRERLWNDVEAAELRKDAQLSREVEFAIPREMNVEQGIALAGILCRPSLWIEACAPTSICIGILPQTASPNPMLMSC